MSVARIKKGDIVIVSSGAARGILARVMRVFPATGKALVERDGLSEEARKRKEAGQPLPADGVRLLTKAVRRSQTGSQSNFVKREAPIALSNLMPYDPDQKRGTRITRERQGGQHARRSKRSGKLLQ